MPYKLLKQRINTNFSRIVKPFKNRSAFAEWTERPDYIIETALDFSDVNLESAQAVYNVIFDDAQIAVEIRLMQSTHYTSYCFDLFLVLRYDELNSATASVIAHYDARLEALRRQYNGDWIIGDGDLTLSALM
ncbi:MAG: hypothetical protein CSA13_00355 [Clostridiales bacterium]|nr:MAG: hypothetical protein CSA13_00355 [Clostridiales bacterium]